MSSGVTHENTTTQDSWQAAGAIFRRGSRHRTITTFYLAFRHYIRRLRSYSREIQHQSRDLYFPDARVFIY